MFYWILLHQIEYWDCALGNVLIRLLSLYLREKFVFAFQNVLFFSHLLQIIHEYISIVFSNTFKVSNSILNLYWFFFFFFYWNLSAKYCRKLDLFRFLDNVWPLIQETSFDLDDWETSSIFYLKRFHVHQVCV